MPTPVITNTQLNWAVQTGIVNRIDPVSSFLAGAAFGGREETLPTESLELSYLDGTQNMAPFVQVNAEAISVGGRSTTFANVSTPNIRIKRPMDAYNAFLRRPPGGNIFISGPGDVASARAATIVEDATVMSDMVDTRLEWMVAQMLTDKTSGSMSLSYQVADRANWKVTVPRSTAMTVALSGGALWSAPTTATPMADFHNAKRAFAKNGGFTPTIAIMGSAAASAFMAIDQVKTLLDNRRIDAGSLALQSQFNASGAIYLGTFMGIPCWEYSREYISDAGASTPFIPTDTVVFLSNNTDNKIYYGAIPDHDAFDQGLFVGKRFSKSWKTHDPSVYVQLLQTRPLPFFRRPNTVYVLDVI